MNVENLDRDAREEILLRDILPLYFPPASAEDSPAFVLLTGQPGTGRLRAVGPAGLRGVAVVNAEELQAFDRTPARLRASSAAEAAQEMAQTAAKWVSGCTRYARENRRSLVVDGAYVDPVVAAAAAKSFEEAGFATRVIIVASQRAESLLTVTSAYLSALRARRADAMVTRAAHDAGLDATRQLAASLEDIAWVDRVTVANRHGGIVYDVQQPAPDSGFGGVRSALAAAQSERMSRWDATQWLSELHHVTDYATSLRVMPDGVAELLVDLHNTALREVIPQLHVPAGGKFASAIEQKTAARLAWLLRAQKLQPNVDASPVLVPSRPEAGGVSR